MEGKQCKSCLEYKKLEYFYAQKRKSKKKGEYMYYPPECRECTKDRFTRWRKENVIYYRAYIRQRHKRQENKDSTRRSNEERRRNGKYKEWQQNNREKMKEYHENRAMNKTHNITKDEWRVCKEYFDYKCAYCNITENEAKEKQGNYFHREHVDHEGANDLSNCVPSCKSCNSSKYTSDFEHWFKELSGLYTDEKYNKIISWLQKDYKMHVEGVKEDYS
ncbi:hypothetical protein BEH_07485 [Priestia filamentosa]|uniref:HNH nuclease domain-containing protein n=1 Tax=Priestia filamentosa TaxID=1402861 RepID=A0A2S1LZB4_9BACI|nr:HNH endonuclease [Priestia filamentosa]AWG44160.1 hypothetical protein BEH_07485 [Priestia filamentosa]